eukprot:m.50326 g.50326  ORF g.50326 m.50326 type:complete len:227 (+) comp18020_c0_seq1:162-842(+)
MKKASTTFMRCQAILPLTLVCAFLFIFFSYSTSPAEQETYPSRVYSIWLRAENEYSLYAKSKYLSDFSLPDLINSLAIDYKAPSFQAHVTLLPQVTHLSADEILTRLRAKDWSSLDLILQDISFGTTFHQCVYVLVDKNNQNLQTLWEESQQLLNLPNKKKSYENDYMPHISVLYSHISEKARKHVVQKLGANSFHGQVFHVREISVVDTTGPEQDWKVIGFVPLK